MSIKFSTQQYFGWKIYEKYFFNPLRIILILSVLSQQISYFESDFRNSATINNNTQMVYTKYSLIIADDVQAIDSLGANSGVVLCRRPCRQSVEGWNMAQAPTARNVRGLPHHPIPHLQLQSKTNLSKCQ
jgi:hypothetical protein